MYHCHKIINPSSLLQVNLKFCHEMPFKICILHLKYLVKWLGGKSPLKLIKVMKRGKNQEESFRQFPSYREVSNESSTLAIAAYKLRNPAIPFYNSSIHQVSFSREINWLSNTIARFHILWDSFTNLQERMLVHLRNLLDKTCPCSLAIEARKIHQHIG